MFDVLARNLNPVVLALLPHREGRGEGVGPVERAERDGDLLVELAVVAVLDV
jgi:hypothetical protein